VLAGWETGRTAVFAAADLSVPTGPAPLDLATRPHPTFQVGVTRALSSRVALELQASAHGPALVGVGLNEVSGWTYYALAGVRTNLARGWFVDFALVENVFDAQAGADFTSVLALEWRP
jgi:hypothetical protein